MKKFFYLLTITFIVGSISLSAQNFANKGVWEFGGSIGFSSTSFVFDGESGDESLTSFMFDPYVGYFIINSLELGIIPSFSTSSYGDFSSNSFGIYFAPAWVFNLQSNVFPFIEGRIGYNTNTTTYEDEEEDEEETVSGLAYGARGGVKVQLGNSALVNASIGYMMTSMEPDGWEGDRIGTNGFDLMVGFTVFLSR